MADPLRTRLLLATAVASALLVGVGVRRLAIGPRPDLPPRGQDAPLADVAERPIARLCRTVFGGGDLCDTEPSPPPDPAPDPAPEGEASPTCDGLPLRLTGTWVSEARTMALLAGADGRASLVRPGESVGDRVLHAVRPTHVELAADDGARCLLPLHGERVATAAVVVDAPPAAAPPALATPRAPPEIPGLAEVTPGHFTVPRETLTAMVSQPHRLQRGLIPALAQDGVRLARLAEDHPLRALGLAQGDVLRAVDGAPVRGSSALLEAYGRLLSGQPVTITVRRGAADRAVVLELAR